MPDTAPLPQAIAVEPAEPSARRNINTLFLGGLFALAALAAFYVAAEIILPIVLAFVLNLVLQPVLRPLQRIGLPRMLAALAVVLALIGLFVVIGYFLSGPISTWLSDLPKMAPRLAMRLHFLSEPLGRLHDALERVQGLAPGGKPALAVDSNPLPTRVLNSVRMVAEGAFTVMLVLFFLLTAGDLFLRRLVEILPRFKDKRQAVDISQQVERDISIYLATITMMNLLVGTLTGIVMWWCGLGDALLWGTVAFLLNYVPVIGPATGVLLFLVTGLVVTDTLWGALLPPGLYLMIHVAEGETITPMLLARRFTINPVLVILSLIFWYWMWGVAGAILSTPMLAIVKIVCDRIESLQPVGHFIEG